MAQAQTTPAEGGAADKQITPAADTNKKQGNKPAQAQTTPAEGGAAAPSDKTSEQVYWVEGYGNVNAKSQADAEKKAKQILADRRK